MTMSTPVASENAAPSMEPCLAWLLPGTVPEAARAMARIEAICGAYPELFPAVLTVLVTHPSVPRPLLAAALRRFRPELAPFTSEDIVNMLAAAWNGGKSGFEAVMRTRSGQARRGGGDMSWLAP
jgi:hypothetical protein